jgi:hypothetical protein
LNEGKRNETIPSVDSLFGKITFEIDNTSSVGFDVRRRFNPTTTLIIHFHITMKDSISLSKEEL